MPDISRAEYVEESDNLNCFGADAERTPPLHYNYDAPNTTFLSYN